MHVWSLSFYNAKVAKTIDAWPAGIRARFDHIATVMREYGPNLGMPHTRALGDGLFEVRAKSAEGIGRAFYCTTIDHHIVIVHAFIKRAQRTPPQELNTARKRLKQVRS